MSRRVGRAARRIGVVSVAAVLSVIASAVPAAAVSKYGSCTFNDDHFDFAVNYLVGTQYRIVSYSYKLYGPIHNRNNIEIRLQRTTDDAVMPYSRLKLDEIPKTSSTAWTQVDIPDYFVPKNAHYYGWGAAIFDHYGVDPACVGHSTVF